MKRALVALLLAAVASISLAAPCQPEPRNILLTNDDGYDTMGIVALHRALKNAGHHVKRVAPDRNYSGSSTSLTLDLIKAPRVPNDEFTEVFAVSGSPATAVLLGASALFTADRPAQLVISGINNGANLGSATPISGTVGATIAAVKLLNPALPAIAISTNMPAEKATAPENLAHVANIAGFLERMLARLQCAPTPWSTGSIALNVNYPPLAPGAIKGVRLAEQGQASNFKIEFRATSCAFTDWNCWGDGHFVPRFGAAQPAPETPLSDTALFNEGYITVVPIDGNYTAGGATLPIKLENIAP